MKTYKQHKQRHVNLHKALDELVADWIGDVGGLLSETSIMTLIKWSYE